MPILEVKILDFCRNGAFGPIHLGITKSELEEILGEPSGWGGVASWWPRHKKRRKHDLPYSEYPIWVYDDLEFHFGEENQLYLIWCDGLDRLKPEGDYLYLDLWLLDDTELSKKVLCRELTREGIEFKIEDFHDSHRIQLESGVEVSCYKQPTEIVYAIGCSSLAINGS